MTDYRIHSYPSVYALGHTAVGDILSGPVLVEEKVDGSQFSFAKISNELYCRSKGKQIVPSAPEKMFTQAVEQATALLPELVEGWVYRCEYLQKPKHNTITYERIPMRHLVLFDIDTGLEQYCASQVKHIEAARLGLEYVPVLYQGRVDDMEQLRGLLATPSFLGGSPVEGVVIKRYDLFTKDKKAMMAKFVSEAFKEKHATEWKVTNPTRTDVIQQLIAELRTTARWEKAIQHLAERGELQGAPQDIGPLIKEVPADVLKEEREYIADALFRYAWPQIQRGIVAGLPQWYKERLAARAFAPREVSG